MPGEGEVALLGLELTTKFVVTTTALGFKMRIATNGVVSFTPDACGVVAHGTLKDATITWHDKGRGYVSRGTMECSGALCGKLGSPRAGRSQFRRGPRDLALKLFKLHDGVARFSTGFIEVERRKEPSQTVLLKLEGRETQRQCIPKPTCPAALPDTP